MSKRNGGSKRRKWSNIRHANLTRWNCPGCGAAMSDRADRYIRDGSYTQYGSPCKACAKGACKNCKRFNGHEIGCRHRS